MLNLIHYCSQFNKATAAILVWENWIPTYNSDRLSGGDCSMYTWTFRSSGTSFYCCELLKKSPRLSWLLFLLFRLQIVLQSLFFWDFFLFHHHLEDSLIAEASPLRVIMNLLWLCWKEINTCTWLILKRQPGIRPPLLFIHSRWSWGTWKLIIDAWQIISFLRTKVSLVCCYCELIGQPRNTGSSRFKATWTARWVSNLSNQLKEKLITKNLHTKKWK